MLVDVEPLPYQDTAVKTDIVPNYNIHRMLCLLMILLLSHILKTPQESEEFLGVLWSQGGMKVENPAIIYGCTKCHISTTGARDFNIGPLAYYVPASPSPLPQIEHCFIHKNIVMGFFHHTIHPHKNRHFLRQTHLCCRVYGHQIA